MYVESKGVVNKPAANLILESQWARSDGVGLVVRLAMIQPASLLRSQRGLGYGWGVVDCLRARARTK